MNMNTSRIEYLDFVKLFTIYLVILGHVIAMMVNGYEVGGRLYSFIYSFHMPLFMLLSGYFVSGSTIKKSFVDFLQTKIRQLILPVVTCTSIVCLYLYLWRDVADYRSEVIGNSWFLKTLFVYYVLFYLLKKIHINDWALFIFSCMLLFIFPGCSSLQVNLLFPYFWGGYFCRKYKTFERIRGNWHYALCFSAIFIVSYCLQRNLYIPNYIEINISNIQSKGHLILFRYIVALSGSMSVISVIALFYKILIVQGRQRVVFGFLLDTAASRCRR